MKITNEQLRQIIKEELEATLREGNGDKASLVKSLNNAVYSLDQGYDQEEISDAKETIARVKQQMSTSDFAIAKQIADLYVYYSEYATRADVEQTKSEMQTLCAQLGITLNDII